MHNNQVLHDLKLNQMPRRLRVQWYGGGDAVAVPGVQLVEVEEGGLLPGGGGVQVEQH